MRDTLPQYPFNIECDIVNLNISDQSGSHWVCYYRNGSDKLFRFVQTDNSRGNSTVSKDRY